MMFPLPFPQSGSSPYEGACGILKMSLSWHIHCFGSSLHLDVGICLDSILVQRQSLLQPSHPWPELNPPATSRSPNPPAQHFSLQQSQGRSELRIIPTWDDALSKLPPSTLPRALVINKELSGDSDRQWKMSLQDREAERKGTNPFEVPWELLLCPW